MGMQVQVNGKAREVQEGLSIRELLAELAFPADRVAVERNRELVARTAHADTEVEDGDKIEIVTLVGGG